jgi:hypothetical protein
MLVRNLKEKREQVLVSSTIRSGGLGDEQKDFQMCSLKMNYFAMPQHFLVPHCPLRYWWARMF